MSEVYMLQPLAASCPLFANAGRRAFGAEPDLAEIMRDPMTEALMAADRVDRRQLCALLSQLRDNLAILPVG